jgi:hypothetical protein
MLGFILLLFIFLSGWIAMLSVADIEEVKRNWPKYRCRPNIMPFASFYGHNTGENFTFCLNNMFGAELAEALGPVFGILSTIVTTLVTILQVANSLRIQLATMMGGINTVFQNFSDRFKQLVASVQQSAYRMKLLMGRLYGTFFAIIYMSIAGITTVDNFTKTILFDFLDTFCFDPDTLVEIENKGVVPVKDVRIGDVFVKTGSKVTSTFAFDSDGQEMVELPGNIVVSTNHYIYSLGKWIQARDHPDAVPKGRWEGGNERPLICFNTSDHTIPIGSYTFLDYDETEEGDAETMKWIDKGLNAAHTQNKRAFPYSTCVAADTHIRMKDGTTKLIQDIQLRDALSTGTVIGLVQKQCTEVCEVASREFVSPGLCYWQTNQWVRAGDVLPIQTLREPQTFYSFVVLKTATFETKDGTFMRDYVEIHSPDAENVYTEKIKTLGEIRQVTLPVH